LVAFFFLKWVSVVQHSVFTTLPHQVGFHGEPDRDRSHKDLTATESPGDGTPIRHLGPNPLVKPASVSRAHVHPLFHLTSTNCSSFGMSWCRNCGANATSATYRIDVGGLPDAQHSSGPARRLQPSACGHIGEAGDIVGRRILNPPVGLPADKI